MDSQKLRERLEARLMSHGVYVTDLERRDDALRLEYETAAPGDGVPDREIGRVLNRLLDALDDGWEPADVEATVYGIDGERRGTWRADAAWLTAHARGDSSDVELSQRVLDTVESS